MPKFSIMLSLTTLYGTKYSIVKIGGHMCAKLG